MSNLIEYIQPDSLSNTENVIFLQEPGVSRTCSSTEFSLYILGIYPSVPQAELAVGLPPH